SPEMADYNRPLSRARAVAELKPVLAHAAFDEVFINTRSHTSLGACMADGQLGLRPLAAYRRAHDNYYTHLGIDLAYAPLAAASDVQLKKLAENPSDVEQITTWQPNEWKTT